MQMPFISHGVVQPRLKWAVVRCSRSSWPATACPASTAEPFGAAAQSMSHVPVPLHVHGSTCRACWLILAHTVFKAVVNAASDTLGLNAVLLDAIMNLPAGMYADAVCLWCPQSFEQYLILSSCCMDEMFTFHHMFVVLTSVV